MYRFFIETEQLNNENVEITSDDYNHIKNVLRMKIGEKLLLSDGSDKEYEACIIGYRDDGSDKAVLLKITDIFESARELTARITLFQGYPKGDKMEQIVQKAVELGACEIVPVMSLRKKFELDDDVFTDKSRIIILKPENELIGIIVDSVKEVVVLSDDDKEKVNSDGKTDHNKYISDVGKMETGLVSLLNINAIMTEE